MKSNQYIKTTSTVWAEAAKQVLSTARTTLGPSINTLNGQKTISERLYVLPPGEHIFSVLHKCLKMELFAQLGAMADKIYISVFFGKRSLITRQNG